MQQDKENINPERPKRTTRGIKPSRYRGSSEDVEEEEELTPVGMKRRKRGDGTASTAQAVSKWRNTLQSESNEVLWQLCINSVQQTNNLTDAEQPSEVIVDKEGSPSSSEVPPLPTSSSKSVELSEKMQIADDQIPPPSPRIVSKPMDEGEGPTVPPAPSTADASCSISSLNCTDCVSRAEWNELLKTVEIMRVAIESREVQPSTSISPPDTPLVVELKSAKGKAFRVQKSWFVKACNSTTLQAVVKSLALGLTFESGAEIYFRGESSKGAVAQQNFIKDLTAVTKMILRKVDKFSQQPVLRIMREGENLKLLKRNKKVEINPSNNSVSMTVDERNKWFANQLAQNQVKSWASGAFRESRRKK